MGKHVLAFDLGASGGRAVLGQLSDGRIEMQEVYRFSNDPVMLGGTLYWDVLRLFYEIKQGIIRAVQAGGFDYIGIDTWAVDFGLIDRNGRLQSNCVHYRDSRTDGIMDEVFAIISKDELYRLTGIQFLHFNTIYQLYACIKDNPDALKNTRLLFMPDLLNYFLTGHTHAEYTVASCTQLIDASSGRWNYNIIDKLHIPRDIFCPIVQPMTSCGFLSAGICEELGAPPAQVISVASHDTASAVVAVPTEDKDFVFLSCGTWSLMGTELTAPLTNEKAFNYNFTNEGGFGGTIRYLKNIMGLWLIQESRRQWEREGNKLNFRQLEQMALDSPCFACFIDPDDPIFMKPGNLPKRVKDYCLSTRQHVPDSEGEVIRCIYESLALKYRHVLLQIESCIGKRFNSIHIVGGGTKDKMLCQMTADCCNVRVIAGPTEAAALGNIAVMLIAASEIKDIWQARKIIKQSGQIMEYAPSNCSNWDIAYARFVTLIEKHPE